MSEFWRILNSLQESSETSKLEDFFNSLQESLGKERKLHIQVNVCQKLRIIASEKDLPVLIS